MKDNVDIFFLKRYNSFKIRKGGKQMKKDNMVTTILIVSIIVVIVGIGGVLIFLFNGMHKHKNQTNIVELSDNNETVSQEQNVSSNEVSSNKEPDGTAMELAIKETKEQNINNGTRKVDFVYIDDFVITIPTKLKEEGYEINLTNHNKVLDITSNDNLYHCKIARFSSVNPYELTEEQENELADLYDEIAMQECKKLGVSEDDDNYYDVYYEEYDKIDASNSNIVKFYRQYGINPYTRFEGFSKDEMENAWNIFDMHIDGLEWNANNEAGGIRKATYKGDNTTAYTYEIDGNQNSFAGMFLQIETFAGDDSEVDDYEVDFWTF